MNIKFGTDGWRAIIAKDYTFDNLTIVTKATARWMMEEQVTDNGVVIGYDARFQGRAFAEHVAGVFAELEIPVKLADDIAPTPAVSWAAQHYDAVGIVITASHNPPEYNGFKIKAPFGGPATPDQIAEVESRMEQLNHSLDIKDLAHYKKNERVEEIELTDQYLNVLKESLDLEAIKNSGIRLAHDPMYGAAQGLLRTLLGKNQVLEIHGEFNPSFRGVPPEPIEKNLLELPEVIRKHDCAVGLANDGDADRIGMFDEQGHFVDSHQMLSLLVKYLSQDKGLEGDVVKTFSTTHMLDKMARKYELPIETTPIGFKYIAEKMVDGDVLVGGEESGGLAVKGHIPERDGLYIGLLITEMVVKSGHKLSELVSELYDEFGPHYFDRNDLHTSDEKKKAMMKYCEGKNYTEIAGKKVVDWQFTDGVKHILEDDSWLLVRPSGTEPVLRIYAEASTEEQARAMTEDATTTVNDPKIFA
ncbi:MAG: phosphoglucomutase/phosphomannomutase family protein [Balneolaceae bacterium]|nr:phosphoglucomutase/phosphomannomutase family protein [Balneolaceae bacterium]